MANGLNKLDRRLQRRSRRRRRHAPALVALGRAADNAKIWLFLSAVLAVADGRFGRRAGLRGLLSIGLASAVANGPVKHLVRRRRPPESNVGRFLAGRPAPSTTSFPSGHSASAFAFATGAATELPVLAAPLAGLAGLVSYSRLHSGAHYPLDVVVGAAVGVAAALGTRRFWPAAPHDGAKVRTVFAPASTARSPDGGGVVVVVNQAAGQGNGTADQLRAELPAAEVVEVEDGNDIGDALEDAAGRAQVLGVAGGDGSINTAAGVAAEAGKPLLVVPGGTLNHFAAALGIDSVGEAAAAVRGGRAVTVDRGLIAGHTFVNTASIGSYCDLVDAREKLEGRIGKWPAVAIALWRVLRHSQPVEMEIDGRRRCVWMIFIGNCRYHPAGFTPSWRERLDDGTLDVRIVDGERPWTRAHLLFSVLTGRLARCRSYEQRFVKELSVRSLEGPLRLARDGETFDGPESFTIAKAETPLIVYAPPA
ncbi:MAG TPA: phosphatase PAP2 family protein [Acidimicrobiales bacterium]|nr:phosphatase PAP2 family protein [Acidimicrobiales bacterium]